MTSTDTPGGRAAADGPGGFDGDLDLDPDLDPAPTADPDPDVTPDRSFADARRRTMRRLVGAFGVLLVLAVLVPLVVGAFHRSAPGKEFRYTIPAGTVERLQRGEDVDVIPAIIELRTQDTLVIENQDTSSFLFGNFSIRAGETFSHRFAQPGDYTSDCTLHRSGAVQILVT